MWEDYASDGLVIIGAMQQDAQGSPPDTSDLSTWCSTFNITHPVTADPQMSQNVYAVLGYPTYVVIDRDMRIVNADLWPWDPGFIIGLL